MNENLNKEENDIIEKLEIQIKDVKKQLEDKKSNFINKIEINEKIKKETNQLKNEEKNMNKNLSYISIINEKEKSINELKKEDIKSIKFSYNEEKKNVIYEKYNINLEEDEEKK